MKSLFKPFSLKKGELWQRFLCLCLALAIVANGLPATISPLEPIPAAEAASTDPTVRYGLVAILVDQKLLDDKNDYPGLSEDYDDVDNERIVDRVQRYASDVQAKNPYTKATIISVDSSQQGAPEIAATLEKLYFDGDSSGENAKLMGVVVVGEVPLPIVNKNGNRFLSLLPYTDFHEKSYLYNPKTDDFEYDNRVSFPRVEVWHGVIRPPEEAKNDYDKASNIALFFDKNHLYHSGHKDFAEFDKNILLSDLYHERELMSTGLFEYYKLLQKNAEDLTYLRNNKHWAEDLYKKFVGDVKEQTNNLPEPVLQPEYEDFLKDTEGLFGNLPDIQSKQAVIDKYHKRYVELFSSYLSKINDWVSYSGRYSIEDAQSVPELISTKDQFTSSYLQEVNTALENKMDELVKKSLQKYIPLISHSSLSGGIVVRVKTKGPDGDDAGQEPDEIEIDEFLRFTHKVRSAQDIAAGGALADDFNYDSPFFLFLNSSLILAAKEQWPKAFTQVDVVLPVFEGEEPLPEGEAIPGAELPDPELEAQIVELMLQYEELIKEGKTEHAKKVFALIEDKKIAKKVEASVQVADAENKLYINGKPAKDIEGPLDCSLYRGSSLLTVNNRLSNMRTAGKMLFLGAINKPILEWGNYQQGLLIKSITPGSPAEKAGLKAGDLLLEINGQILNKDFGDGERFMLEDVLNRLNPDKQSSATIKYFSQEQGKEIGPVNVALENANAAKWANGCYGTNGIEIEGQDNSNKCIAQLSKIPLFDAGAGKEISATELHSGQDVDSAHIRSCYDIFYDEEPRYAAIVNFEAQFSKQPFVKLIEDFFAFNSDEPKKYLNPLAKFTTDLQGLSAVDSDFHNLAKDIILYDKNGFSLTFIDVLNHAGAFDGIDNDGDGEVDEDDENDKKYAVNSEDWAAIGERVLSRSGTFRFDMPEVQGEVEIKIEPNVVKWISSMIPHKEPTNETIGVQDKATATLSLPTDKNRYLAFWDKNSGLQKINYPNLFDATSYQDFQVRLYKLAKEIAAVPGSEKLIPAGEKYDATEAIYRELLLTVDPKAFLAEEDAKDISDEDKYGKTETGQQVLQSSFKNKVEDALAWKNLGIDDKHDYIITSYLNPNKNAYIDERNGYEALYLVADGEHDYASFSFYGDYPAAALDVTVPAAGAATGGGSGAVGTEGVLDDGAANAGKEDKSNIYNKIGKEKKTKPSVPLLQWFPEMAVWIEETVDSVTQIGNYDFSVGSGGESCKVGDYDLYDALTDSEEEEKAEEGVLAELKIKMNKGTLRADGKDKAILTVKALDKFAHFLPNENKTEIEIVIAPTSQSQVVLHAYRTKIVNGVASFEVNATREPGDVILQVATTNAPQRLLSNALQLKVTDRDLAVDTYQTIEEGLTASNEVLAGSTLPLQVQASLLDEQGTVLRSESGQKVIFELDDNNTLASLAQDGGETAAGVAKTELKAGTKAGILKLRAKVNSSLYPVEEKDVYVMPGPLNRVNIVPKSMVIKSGGVSYTPVRIQLEDEFGNIKNDELYQLTIWHDGPGEFKNIEDENSAESGIQVTAPEGVIEFVMASTDDPGPITIHAETVQQDPTEETEDQKFYNKGNIQSRNDIYLSAASSVQELPANGQSQAVISVSVNDSKGTVEEVNLPVSLSVSQEALAFFNSEVPAQVNSGKAYASVQANFISGKTEVLAAMPGFDSVIVPLAIRPLEPYRVEFIEPEGGLTSDDVSTLEIEARILDKHGNFVDNDDASNVTFSISEGTKQVAEFLLNPDLIAQDGKVTATLKSTLFSGPLRIKAGGQGLAEGDNLEIFSEKRMPSSTFKNSNAKVLFASLLGNAFGDVNKKNNLASGLLFSGYTEAISATTMPLEQKKILFTLGANGQVQLLDTSTIKAVYGASNNKISSDKVSLLDLKTNSVLAEASVLLPLNSFVKVDGGGTGVHIQNFINVEPYTLKEDGGDVLLLHNEIPHVRVSGRGQITTLQGNYNVLPVLEDQQFLTFQVSSGTQQIFTVQIRPSVSNDAIVVEDDYQFSASSPVGAYLIRRNQSNDYKLAEFYTGNSNTSLKGLAWQDVNQTPDAQQVIGGPHTSLEGAFDKIGIGFTGQNKHMLLFFAGNSVGESFLPYASETGIVLGDPTVRLKPSGINNGFSADLGQSIYTDSKNVKSLEKIDYNSDGVEDLLAAYEDGKVRLLEGVLGNPNKPFEDKGNLLNIVNAIYALAVGDINNDGQQDIVVATKESCNQGETCVYFFENFNGHFLQKNAGLNLQEKVSDLKIADFNKDGFGDLLVADLNRSISAFYGSKGGIKTDGKYIGGLEAAAQEGVNTAHQTFIAYNRSGVEIETISKSYGFDPFIAMNLPSANPADTVADDQTLSASDQNILANLAAKDLPGLSVKAAPVLGKKIYNFLPLDRDLRFDNSLKKTKDSNGGDVKSGDNLEYSITLVNEGEKITNAAVMDYVPESFTFDKNSIKCEGCNSKLEILDTGIVSRPYLLTGINIGANQTVKITYSLKAATFPPLQLIVGENFADYPDDDYLDIVAFPEGKPENHVIYYSAKEGAQVNYLEKFPDLPESGATKNDPVAAANQDVGFAKASLENDKNGNGRPDNYEGFDEDTSQSTIDALLPNDEKANQVAQYLGSGTRDKDLDGLPDVIDKVNGALEDVADGIEATIAALKCSGGCIPMPVNMTLHLPFPVPGKVNLFGIPAGYVPGIPLFAITKPSTLAPPAINTVIWPAGNPFYFESIFRIYASPTLTGGLGTAFCLGEYAWTPESKANSCFIFAVPVLQALGVCKALTGGIAGALNSVKSAAMSASSSGSGLTAVVSLGSNPATAANAGEATGFSMGPIPVSASVASNVRIPGFPSVIVNWFDRQTEEIVDKLMDLPDIYLILPEPKSLLGGAVTPTKEWSDVSDMNEFLSYINSIPLVQLEQKEVMIKIPWLYEDQIEKTIRQYERWIENFKNEWERFKNTVNCSDENAYDNICNKLHLNVENIIAKMEHNIQMLEEYRELPKKLLKFRNFEAQYIRQLVCYLDTIINYTGGYVQKQGDRIAAWIKAIDKVKKTFLDWKIIVDIALTYAESCDACKTDKFSLLEFLLRFLVIIPEPPIIEMPKWPDIVIDVSQIQAGLKVVVPDFVFVPEPLILPPPPKFQFPDVLLPEVNIKVTLPSIPSLPEIPEISLPELPSLPALPLPALPDIPPPPEIPELPKPVVQLAATFNVLFRIFCLVKQGLLPLPEPEVSTEFETLTQRSLSPLLPSPFDMSLSFQLPPISYTYLNEIEIIAKLNLQLDINTIYDKVLNASEVINSYTSYGTDYVNKKVLEYGKVVDDYVIDKSDIQLKEIKVNIDIPTDKSPTIEDNLSSFLQEESKDMDKHFAAYLEEVEKINAYSRSLPKQIVVKAESTLIDTSHPIFDHSIADIKQNIARQNIDQLAPSKLVAYRDQLIAYHDSLENGTASLENASNDREFMRFLAQENNAPLLADSSFNLGEKNPGLPEVAAAKEVHPLAQNIKEAGQIHERIIALTDEEKGIGANDQASPKGLFIFNEKENVNQNLISYTEEINAPSHLVHINVDDDDDEDIIYSFGGDVYLKRNYTEMPAEYYDDDPEIVELKELMPTAAAVNYLTTTLNANEKTQVAWDPAATYDLAAYEMEIKYRFGDFGQQDSAGSLAHIIAEKAQTDAVFTRPDYYTHEVISGQLFVNGQSVADINVPKIKANDLLQTSTELTTEIHLTAHGKRGNNLGMMKLGPSTNWVAPRFEDNKNTQVNVAEGEIIFELQDGKSPYLSPGDTIKTGASAKVLINYQDAGSFLVNANQTFTLSAKALAPMYIDDSSLFAKATINGKQRFITTEATGTVQDGDVIHMIEASTLEAKGNDGQVVMEISQPAHSLFTVPNGLPKETIFYVKKGKVEVIRQAGKKTEQKLLEGGMIDAKDFVTVYNGDITLLHSDSLAQAKVSANQTFALYSFSNAEKPEAEIELLNGSYYASMRALLKNNSRGTGSLSTILAPQSCGDKTAPYINVGETEKSIAVFQTAEVDAASSFDTAGEVVAYYADTDLEKDSDGNGDKTDDKDLFSDDPNKNLGAVCFKNKKMDNSVFNFGPYNEPGEYKVKIFAVDQSCNVSGQVVTIKVFVPDIYLDPTSARSGVLSGYIEPRLANVPIRFVRDRKPPLENFATEAADEQGVYYTNAAGEFTVTDLATGNIIVVTDDNDKQIAEVDPYSGNITLQDGAYQVAILPARPPDFPTRAAIIDQNDEPVASFFIVPDLNNDTAIVEEINSDSNQLQVKVSNNDDFKIEKLPASDPVNPGATVISYVPENKQIVLINSSGNIFALDERVRLALKEVNDNQFNIHLIEIFFNDQPIAEVYLPGQNADGVMPTIAERDVYKFNIIGEVPAGSGEFTSPFADVDENTTNYDAILNLAQKGIIDGYQENGQTVFKPEQLISRAEYTKILLKTLCIEPRPEAYEAPSTFWDITFDENNLPWYYPFVKESFLQTFIAGYVGEKDPVSGLTPFKPGDTITRAEAATIILSALNKLGTVNLEGIQPGDPWYAPYIEVAQNLGPYLNNPQENSQLFLLTPEEAQDPQKQITRAEFAIMAERVLNISNCFTQDEDNDGMPSQWEKENNLNPYDPADAKFDDDKDELDNLGEYQNGTDPFNPDTDGGCMQDGPEVKATFNAANNPLDDDPDFDGLSCDAEKTTYKTDPYKADTDGGGVNDGQEVLIDKTDPLFEEDDNEGHFEDVKTDLEEGVYAIEESCNSCPCDSSIANKADILLGDDFWAVISAPSDANKIYKKSNSVTINNVP